MSAPWAEKYRPKTLEECILPESIMKTAKGIVSSDSLPNLLLSGSPGTGKTTLARVLARELGYDVMFINASNEGRLIDTLRVKIQNYASSVSFSGSRKMVILDEADYMPTETVQPAMRAFLEEFSENCAFVLTCNHRDRIIPALQSRMTEIQYVFSQEDKKAMMLGMSKRIFGILEENGVEYDPKAVAALVKNKFPNFRSVLNDLQRYSVSGKVDSGILISETGRNMEVLLDAMYNKKFNTMREWAASQTALDYYSVSRYLYSKADEICAKESIPQLVLTLADYQFKDSFVADKEINLVAMLAELMTQINFKG